MKKPNFMDRLASEIVLFGGLPLTRAAVYQHMADYEPKCRDYFAWGVKAWACALPGWDNSESLDMLARVSY